MPRRHPLSRHALSRILRFALQQIGREPEDGELDDGAVGRVASAYNTYCHSEGIDDVLIQATAITVMVNREDPVGKKTDRSNINAVVGVMCGVHFLDQEARARGFFIYRKYFSFFEGLVSFVESFKHGRTDESLAEGVYRYYKDIWDHSLELSPRGGGLTGS